jgi:CheY-like chemotaxis protein
MRAFAIHCEGFSGPCTPTSVAVDGLDGLAQLEHCQPDVIFCDLEMPTISGLEFAQRLRQDSRFGEPPLIAVTGSAPDVLEMQRAGFHGHLLKPFTKDALTRLALRLTARRRCRASVKVLS